MKFIINDKVVLLRAPDGPLAPYIVSFSKWVIGQGYAPCSLRRRIRIAVGFSRWLAEKSVRLHSVSSRHFDQYLRYRARRQQICEGDTTALKQLLDFLRDHEVIPVEKIRQRRLSPVEQQVHAFERYLREERVLATATIVNYVRFIREFLKLFAIVSKPCFRGHYLRNRSGHCIQCDTKRIEFIKRHHREAYVYVAGSRSERVLKIGCSEAPWSRGPHLNQLGYGEISDWEILYYASFPDAGKVEFNAHNALLAFASPRKWFREHVETHCREIFACAYITARNALSCASTVPGKNEWEYDLASRLYGFIGYLRRE